ncbi:MAG: hypothetical protein V1735_03995 [Nanoarchaeota archaeon]
MRVFPLVLVLLVVMAGCRSVSREEALGIAQDFVNTKVKFFTTDNQSVNPIQEAKISIIHTERRPQDWLIILDVESPQTNKTNRLYLTIDARNSSITSFGKMSPDG